MRADLKAGDLTSQRLDRDRGGLTAREHKTPGRVIDSWPTSVLARNGSTTPAVVVMLRLGLLGMAAAGVAGQPQVEHIEVGDYISSAIRSTRFASVCLSACLSLSSAIRTRAHPPFPPSSSACSQLCGSLLCSMRPPEFSSPSPSASVLSPSPSASPSPSLSLSASECGHGRHQRGLGAHRLLSDGL
jgi:hypothetical protein